LQAELSQPPSIKDTEESSPALVSRFADHPKLKFVARQFVDKLAGEIEVLNQAHHHDNLSEVATLAHWLKGAAGTVGFDDFTKPAEQLEIAARENNRENVTALVRQINALQQRTLAPADAPVNGASRQELQDRPPAKSGNEPIISRLASHPQLKKVVNSFIVKLPGELSKMETALTSGDYLQLAHLAHWLKGAAGTVGFDTFTKPATELEQFAKSSDCQNCKDMLEKIKIMAHNIEAPL
jgi:HPt (histidine-containing phosphotransfer) domain-containing protein